MRPTKLTVGVQQPSVPPVRISEIPIGMWFSACVGAISHGIFLRTYNGIVHITDPVATWEKESSVQIRHYKPYANVQLTLS